MPLKLPASICKHRRAIPLFQLNRPGHFLQGPPRRTLANDLTAFRQSWYERSTANLFLRFLIEDSLSAPAPDGESEGFRSAETEIHSSWRWFDIQRPDKSNSSDTA